MQWIYTQYLSMYTQYLAYFASILILLTSAAAISLIKTVEKKMWWVALLLSISFVLALFDVYLVFEIYDSLRTTLLLMSGQCVSFSHDVACDIDIQSHSSYLKTAIMFMIASFVSLVLGYLLKAFQYDRK